MRKVARSRYPSDPLAKDARSFGAAIRAARTAAGMTIPDAALLLGVSKQTLASLETATVSVGLATALRIAHALGVGVFVVAPEKRLIVRGIILNELALTDHVDR